MGKLDLVLEKIRQLPEERQEALAVQLEILIEDEAQESLLTDAQWAEVREALADEAEPTSRHQDVFARLRTSADE